MDRSSLIRQASFFSTRDNSPCSPARGGRTRKGGRLEAASGQNTTSPTSSKPSESPALRLSGSGVLPHYKEMGGSVGLALGGMRQSVPR